MGDSDKLEYAGVISAEDVAAYLELMAAGLRRHVMLVESGDASVAIDIAREVKMELEARADRKKSSIELKVSWRPDEGEEVGERPPLRVVTRDALNDNGNVRAGTRGTVAEKLNIRTNGAATSDGTDGDRGGNDGPDQRPTSEDATATSDGDGNASNNGTNRRRRQAAAMRSAAPRRAKAAKRSGASSRKTSTRRRRSPGT